MNFPLLHSRFFRLAAVILAGLALGAFWIRSGSITLPSPQKAALPAKGEPKYHCPMHPSIVSDKPGKCSICGMDLVPIEGPGSGGRPAPQSGVPGLAAVEVSPQARQTLGLKLGTVETRPIAREVRTSAKIATNETRQWRVTPKVDGWVDQLFVSYVGQEVKKGDPLLTIYSPALVSAQAEFLTALHARGPRGSSLDSLLSSARKRLELWDISAEQINRLERTGTVEKYLTLHAPASGVVTSRDVLAGQKIAAGDALMVIADLSTVWGDADIYQSDIPYVKVEMPLSISFPYWPEKAFAGKIIFVSPTLDPESRTLKARLEIPNPESLIKPGMYGEARLSYELGPKLSIPAPAVMYGAQHTYAFRDDGGGRLVPVEIKIGVRSNDQYELLGGLKEGDQVAVSANFLIDSESNLKAAMEALQTGPAPTSEPLSAADFAARISAYLELQEALARDDLASARAAARSLRESGAAIASAPDLAAARLQFQPLSATMIASAGRHGAPAGQPLAHMHCPMAFDGKGGDWLQKAGQTANPYFGQSMAECGENQGTIAPR